MDASGCSVLVLHVPANAGILMKPATMFWTNFWKIEFLPRADFAPSFTLTCINIMGLGFDLRQFWFFLKLWVQMRTGELKPSLFSALFCSVEVAQYILFILGYLDTLHTRLHVFWAECTSRESTNCAVCEPVHQLLTDAVQTPVAANTQSYKYTKHKEQKHTFFNMWHVQSRPGWWWPVGATCTASGSSSTGIL